MAGSPGDDSGVGGSSNGNSSGRYQTGEALAEWRSSEQVENGTPSTSPPYWDTDDDDDDCGPKPSELYGKFTWKIEKFTGITKRELRSNAFEVGGYKWYILIYPQGCDVCNHLSLFLCVANHDKLLPGWSHFAQFTIAVVNKDPKKSKYSDTLHRFWKKEHDWGWKKFMELSKVLDGFIVDDTLVIKAQVQVIREKLDRPFRCLDCQYRRELVRVYLTNVEQICRRFVEERRGKLEKLIDDEARWSSFSSFWSTVKAEKKRHMCTEKTDVILKVVVKHFFIEKEVTSTLVMDSLYSGLKALECQHRSNKGIGKSLDTEETPDPIVCVENDMFVLAGDVLELLQRAAREPLPPKDEKGPQNRTKDGNSGEDLNKDSIERDERRLTELGRRSVEIFVLAHIFSSKIEVAHQEDVALKKQEELIREEEAAWQAGSEQKARRGASDKEKRANKKKQSKQKRSNRKAKDKGRDEKCDVDLHVKKQREGLVDVRAINDFSVKEVLTMLEKSETLDDVSDVSFNGDDTIEILQPDVEDGYASPLNSDTDTSEVHHIDRAEVQPATEACSIGVCEIPIENGQASKKTNSVIDDSSSTCSTDSVPSVVNGSYKGHSLTSTKAHRSSPRGKKQHGKGRRDQTGCAPDLDNRLLEPVTDVGRLRDTSGTCRANDPEAEVDVLSMNDQMQRFEHRTVKEEETVVQQKNLVVNDHVVDEMSSKQIAEVSLTLSSISRNLRSNAVRPKAIVVETPAPVEAFTSDTKSHQDTVKGGHLSTPSPRVPPNPNLDARRSTTLLTPEKPTVHMASGVSRPSSTPLIPAPRLSTPVASMVQTTPLLSRSASATGRLGIDSSAATSSYAPSYRNAIMGKLALNPAGFTSHPSGSGVSSSSAYANPLSAPVSSSLLSSHQSGMSDRNGVRSGFTFGSVTPEILQSRPQWLEFPQHDPNMFHRSSELNGPQNLDIYGSGGRGSQTYFTDLPAPVSSNVSTRQAQGVSPDEFPHLDIINYLLDEEHSIAKGSKANSTLDSYSGHDQHPRHHHPLSRQYTFPGEISGSSDVSPSNYSRYDQQDIYRDNGVHSMYGSSSGNYSGLREAAVPMAGHSAYGNGHVDGVSPNQWPYGVPDISLLSIRNSEYDGYPYQLPDYSNLVSGVTGYTSYRPSNGR